jgi:acetyl esterase/lipase
VLKAELVAAFAMGDIQTARHYLDAVVIDSPVLPRLNISAVQERDFRGSWFGPKGAEPATTLLYLHGGGYSFYPKAHANLIAMITLEANSRTFALDYRLSPEHRFPTQLEDALNAYRWLLGRGVDPANLVVAGDSAGANLTLALLQQARDSHLPLPALAIAISPPTDFDDRSPSLTENEPFDWIAPEMLLNWASWFCSTAQYFDPLVSPIHADLRGLPPIYIQAGRAELLFDSIQAFAKYAESQGANVVLESWAEMNHDFQMFGYKAPQSAEALRRIGEVIRASTRKAVAGVGGGSGQ